MMRKTAVLLLLTAALALTALHAPARGRSFHFASARAPALSAHQAEIFTGRLGLEPSLSRAWILMSGFRFREARDAFAALLAKDPQDAALASEAYTWLGYCHMNLRETVRAREALGLALRRDGGNELARYFLSQVHLLGGEREQARRLLLEAVKIRPQFVAAFEALARLDADSGDTGGAISSYSAIVALLPASAYHRSELANAYMRHGDYPGAERELLALIDLEKSSAVNYQRLGDVYLLEGSLEKADASFDKALALEPSIPSGSLGKARVLLARGDFAGAKRQAMRALSLQPDSQDVQAVLRDINGAVRERREGAVKVTLIAAGVAVLVVALVVSVNVGRRRKYVIEIIAKFNSSLEEMTEKDRLAEFLAVSFADLFQASRALLLTYNRQSSILGALKAVGLERESDGKMQIFTGGDVAAWTLRRADPLLGADEITRDSLFATAFPDLAERMAAAQLHWALVLKEKSIFVGFLLLGGVRSRRMLMKSERDLVNPLLSLSAGALNSFYLYETSVLDETTGLFNKRYFKQSLAMELRRADRYQQPCSVITFDIDNFKKVNDVYGHGQGDKVLAELGSIVLANIREGIDTAARTGGEEFSLILPATSEERALATAERLRASVEEHVFPGFPKKVTITVSIGVATYPLHGASDGELAARADEAQYVSKKTGKNKVTVAKAAPAEGAKAGEAFFLDSRFDGLNVRDEKTGIFNATYFSMRLKDEIRRVSRYLVPCSLMLVRAGGSLDDEARRRVMKQMGAVLKDSLREGIDTPAALDESTIAVILPETPPENALLAAQRMKAAIEKKAFEGTSPAPTVSIGVVSCPYHGREEHELMRSASLFLARAHEEGRGGVITGEAEPDEGGQSRAG